MQDHAHKTYLSRRPAHAEDVLSVLRHCREALRAVRVMPKVLSFFKVSLSLGARSNSDFHSSNCMHRCGSYDESGGLLILVCRVNKSVDWLSSRKLSPTMCRGKSSFQPLRLLGENQVEIYFTHVSVIHVVLFFNMT